jgi:hypothetical protein
MATETTNTANVVNEPTSEKLVSIKQQISDTLAKIKTAETTEEQMELISNVSKLNAEKTAEINAIKNEARAAELREKQNKKIALIDNVLSAHKNVIDLSNDKKATEEQKLAASDNLAAAVETLKNELIGTVKPTATATASGSKGATGNEIREKFIAARSNGGKTDTEIKKDLVAEGYAVGTVGAVVLAYQREIGEKE